MIVVGCLLDLVLRHRDEDLVRLGLDAGHDAGGDQALLAEDPVAGVDDQAVDLAVVGRFVDLADVLAVVRLDVEVGEVDRRTDEQIAAKRENLHGTPPEMGPP